MSTFEEQYKKYKQKKQAEEVAKKQKVSAFEQQYKRYRAQSVAEVQRPAFSSIFFNAFT